MASRDKEKILKSAITLFSKYGFDSVTLREIAFECGIDKKVLVDYFEDKEQLFDCILDSLPSLIDHYEPTREEILCQLETETPQEILNRYASFYRWDYEYFNLCLYRFTFMEINQNKKAQSAIYNHILKRPMESAVKTLDLLIELKKIPPCDTRALVEMWNRSALVFCMVTTHPQYYAPFDCYLDLSQLFIQIAVQGVKHIHPSQIQLQWEHQTLWDHKNFPVSDTKQSILSKALHLFGEHGYNNTSIQKLAKEAGIHASTIYNHFAGKSDIMKNIVDSLLDSYRRYTLSDAPFEAILASMDPERIILTLASPYPPFNEELTNKLYRVLYREQFYNDDIREFFIGHINRDILAITKTLDQMIHAGRINPCDSHKIASAYVYSMCSIELGAAMLPGKQQEIDDLRVRIVSILVSLIINGYSNAS